MLRLGVPTGVDSLCSKKKKKKRHGFSGKSDFVFRRYGVPPDIPRGTLPGTTEKTFKKFQLGHDLVLVR